jgi:hypothetical protein
LSERPNFQVLRRNPGQSRFWSLQIPQIIVHGVSRTLRLVYGRSPFIVLEVVRMSSFKYRAYPVMIAAISILAATGGAWRTT